MIIIGFLAWIGFTILIYAVLFAFSDDEPSGPGSIDGWTPTHPSCTGRK